MHCSRFGKPRNKPIAHPMVILLLAYHPAGLWLPQFLHWSHCLQCHWLLSLAVCKRWRGSSCGMSKIRLKSPCNIARPQNKPLQRTCPLAPKDIEQFVSSPHLLFFAASPSFLWTWGYLHSYCHQHQLRFPLAWVTEDTHGLIAELGSRKQPWVCCSWSSLWLGLVGDRKSVV